MLVAYGVCQDGASQLLGFLRTRGESQAHLETLLNDLYRRPGRGRRARFLPPPAQGLSVRGQTVRARSARTAGLLPIPKAPVAQATHHQHHRALLRRSARRTRPMVCLVNGQSVDRIIYSLFQRFNLEWKTLTLRAFTQALHIPANNKLRDIYIRRWYESSAK